MSNELNATQTADIRAVLQLVIDRGKGVDVVMSDRKQAEAFRFRLYGVKKREKKLFAAASGLTVAEVGHVYDNLRITIHKTNEVPLDKRHSVRITPINSVVLEVLDTETGDTLDVNAADPDYEEWVNTEERNDNASDEPVLPTTGNAEDF